MNNKLYVWKKWKIEKKFHIKPVWFDNPIRRGTRLSRKKIKVFDSMLTFVFDYETDFLKDLLVTDFETTFHTFLSDLDWLMKKGKVSKIKYQKYYSFKNVQVKLNPMIYEHIKGVNIGVFEFSFSDDLEYLIKGLDLSFSVEGDSIRIGVLTFLNWIKKLDLQNKLTEFDNDVLRMEAINGLEKV